MRTSLAREAKADAADAWGLLACFGRESAGALTLLAEGEQEAAGAQQKLPLILRGETPNYALFEPVGSKGR